MNAIRDAERAVAEIVIELHWLAHQIADETMAHHLRGVADKLHDAGMELRSLWESGGELFGHQGAV